MLTRFTMPRILAATRLKAIEMYKTGVPVAEILGALNISNSSLYTALREAETRFDRLKKYSVSRPDFFSSIETEEQAYFLGWMVSDGYICKVNNTRYSAIGIRLVHTDAYVIERFKQALGATAPINKRETKTKPTADFMVHCQQLVDDLAQHGVVPRKSAIAFYPKLPDQPLIQGAFIRGLFDGDGCASHGYFNLFGTNALLHGVAEALTRYAGVRGRRPAFKRADGYLHYLQYTAKHEVVAIHDFMYGNAAEELYLTRKRQKLKTVFEVRSKGRLNMQKAREIREKFKSGSYTKTALGNEYGVTQSTIWKVINNERWKD